MIDESDVQIKLTLKHANGKLFSYPEGRHNSLLVDILEVLVPYHAPNSVLIYVQDKVNRLDIFERGVLEQLGVPRVIGVQLADIVIYQPQTNKLYFIYAINRFGPVFKRRKDETEVLLRCCSAERGLRLSGLQSLRLRSLRALYRVGVTGLDGANTGACCVPYIS